MTPPTETDVELTRQDNIARILDAADRAFRHYGYGKTTVADIAHDLGMSTANIYRFFTSKVEIHQAVCARMLEESYRLAYEIRHLPIDASDRLLRHVESQYRLTVDTMLDETKVHEMIIVAIERHWAVIEVHLDRIHDLVAEIIQDGIDAGEFAKQDAVMAARCFSASMVTLCHPQLVAQCLEKTNRATVDELVEFAIRALKK